MYKIWTGRINNSHNTTSS